jgi:hypothetical protein
MDPPVRQADVHSKELILEIAGQHADGRRCKRHAGTAGGVFAITLAAPSQP